MSEGGGVVVWGMSEGGVWLCGCISEGGGVTVWVHECVWGVAMWVHK